MTEFVPSQKINSKFLVLGITGPLNSGCSTLANFIVKKQKIAINDIDESKVQECIEFCYRKINALLEKEEVDKSNISIENRELKKYLREREIYKTLNNYSMPEFQYISLSKCLIKYTIEYYLKSRKKNYGEKYKIITNAIDFSSFEKNDIVLVNKLIRGKKYRSLNLQTCITYDNYLNKIDEFINYIKSNINRDTLGTILQDIGDNIRLTGNPFSDDSNSGKFKNAYKIAEEANLLIKYYRNRQDNNRFHHFVIENFRNPYEVEFFRFRYYEFYLVAVSSERKTRESRPLFSEKRDIRDQGSKNRISDFHKQNVSKCVYFADIVINNNETLPILFQKWLGYFSLIVRPGTITPTSHELFMNQAYSMSLKSSCISRQVGAIIVGKNGYVIGAGWNDAGEGQIGCGYRQIVDLKQLGNDILPTNPKKDESFRRLLRRGELSNNFCYKDEFSKYEVKKKIMEFMSDKQEFFKQFKMKKEQQGLIQDLLSNDIKIKRLEFCRALHAEENALLQSAKIGGLGVVGSTIYSTYFPCELCAKKIYQAGISEVVYVEPYPESISQDVIFRDGSRRVHLTPFEGVMSHSYFRLFKPTIDKKEYQQLKSLMVE